MKRVLLILLGAVLLLGAAGAFCLSRMDAGFVVERIAEVTERATGAPLLLEAPPHLTLLPPGIRFGQARWQGTLGGNALEVSLHGGMARLELAPLFSGNIVISELRLDRPEADIRLGPPGGDPGAAGTPDKAPDAARKAPDDALPFELARLTVSQGSLRITDGARRAAISGFNLALENLRRREEASVQGDLVLAVSEAAPATADAAPLLEGNLAFKGGLRYYAPNLTFRQLSLVFTPLGGVIPRGLAPLQLTGEGALDLASLEFRLGAARLSAPQARLTLQGQGALAPPAFAGDAQLTGSVEKLAALAGLALPGAGADSLDLRCRLGLTRQGLRLTGIGGAAAGVSLDGALALELPAARGAAPALSGSLRLGALALDRWLGAAPPREAQAPAPQAAPRPAQAAPAAAASPLPALDLRLAIAALRHGAFALQDVSLHLTGAAGRYALRDLGAKLPGGGALGGALTLDRDAGAWTLAASGREINIGALCAAAGKPGLASGRGAFNARLRAAGTDSRALLASLEGDGVLEAHDLASPALHGAVAALKALPLRGLAIPDRIDSVAAPFTASGGEITARPVTILAGGLSARGEARVSLPREYLEGSATVAAAGLTIPLDFKGPFGDIAVSVDPKFLLQPGNARGLLPSGAGASRGAGRAVRDGLGAAGGIVRGLLGR